MSIVILLISLVSILAITYEPFLMPFVQSIKIKKLESSYSQLINESPLWKYYLDYAKMYLNKARELRYPDEKASLFHTKLNWFKSVVNLFNEIQSHKYDQDKLETELSAIGILVDEYKRCNPFDVESKTAIWDSLVECDFKIHKILITDNSLTE